MQDIKGLYRTIQYYRGLYITIHDYTGLYRTIQDYTGMVDDHPWQLSPGVSFVSKVLVPNYKSVLHLFLVGDHP